MSLESTRSATSLALEIPELLGFIALYISDNRHLTACALVCKAWNEKFSASLYRHLKFNINTSPNTLSGAIRHADHMRSLEIATNFDKTLFPLPFNRLRTLTIMHRSLSPDDPTSVILQVSNLIRQNNSTLQDITVCYMNVFTPALWEAISTCSKLGKIRLTESIARGVDMLKLLDAIKQARVFDVIHASIDFSEVKLPPTTTSPLRLPNLQHLQIFMPKGFLGDISTIIQHAPNLRSLNLDSQLQPRLVPHMRELVVPLQRCQKLQDISLLNMRLSSEESAMVLDATMDAKLLNWEVRGFSQNALRSLISRHARTITDLYLVGSPELCSSMTQAIMTSCPLLEFLRLFTISGTDLVRVEKAGQGNQNTERVILGEDWICLGLKTLSLQFDLSSKTMNIDRNTPEGEAVFQRQQQLEQYHAFRQIGRLTRLQDLLIIKFMPNGEYGRSLDLRLEANGGGLEGLAALKELDYIEFRGTKQELSKDEIDWMLYQLPRLSCLKGRYHSDEAKNENLNKYAGVRLRERHG
ncbi:hypothetical protein BGX27_009127 [Mortierella sp. AM989]|nr:hypothetical protein BGX27_009127 [Mortierella sp. AM989]